MLRTEDNELITRVGPGTAMGRLMREYWVPAMLSSELPGPDCDPVRVMLLGEPLIGFRDTSGRVGLLQNHCPHRGASLFYGRNEGDGLRCIYHGWKFDVAGRCTDMPSEPPESVFKDKVRARAYPCVERGGMVWTYMGPRETPPPLPCLEASELPSEASFVDVVQRECNWLQSLEGDIDDSHVTFLHFGLVDPGAMPEGSFVRYATGHRGLRYSVHDADYGVMYGAYRPTGDGRLYWRVGQFLFPFYTNIPTGVLGDQILTQAWVPMDDYHTLSFRFGAVTPDEDARSHADDDSTPAFRALRERARSVPARHPNTADWYGRFRTETDAANDYRVDRKLQRSETFTGMEDLNAEDQAVTESMGPIYDRSQEHLGTTDAMLIRVRRRLLNAARDLVDLGVVPPGVDNPEVYGIRSGGILLPEGADWLESVGRLGPAHQEHPDLDLTPERFF